MSTALDFETFLSKENRRPPCDLSGQFPYTRRWAGDPQKTYCAQKPAGFWDATTPAREGDLTSDVRAGVSLILLQKGSRMYHGYGGEKIGENRHRSLAKVSHDTDKKRCEFDDTITCYKGTDFSWLGKLINSNDNAFKAAPLFVAPKTTADLYGENKRNTVVVSHRNPSGHNYHDASHTVDKCVPMYQVPELNGTTITFSLTEDATLVDISCVETAKIFLTWCEDFERKCLAYEEKRSALIDQKRSLLPTKHEEREELEKQINALEASDYDPYKIETLRSHFTVENDRIKRISFFNTDADLVVYVKLWLRDAGLAEEVHGWFWGGSKWGTYDGTETAGGSRSLESQEMCYFNPSRLLAFKSHTKQITHEYVGIPTYDKFWAQANVTTMKESIDSYGTKDEMNLFYPAYT